MKKYFCYIFIIALFLIGCGSGENQPEPSTASLDSESVAVLPAAESEETEVQPTLPASEPTAEPLPTATVEPEATPTQEPEPTPTPTAEPTPTQIPLSAAEVDSFIFDLDQFNSFAFALEVAVIDATSGDVKDIFTMSGANDSAIGLQRLSLGSDEDVAAGNGLAMTQIDGIVYSQIDASNCVTTPANDEQTLLNDMSELGAILDGFAQLQAVNAGEVINGVETVQYTFDSAEAQTLAADLPQVYAGDVYIAAEGQYVVRIEMEGEQANLIAFSAQATAEDLFRYTYNVTNVGQPILPSLPPACVDASATGSYPKVEDATDVFTMEGMEAYSSELEADEIRAFYQDALAAEGWTYSESESYALGSLYTDIYTQNDDRLQLSLAPNGDKISVTLLINP